LILVFFSANKSRLISSQLLVRESTALVRCVATTIFLTENLRGKSTLVCVMLLPSVFSWILLFL